MTRISLSPETRRMADKFLARRSRLGRLFENLESRLLLSTSTTTVSSTELGNTGSYLDSGTTGITGITPPSGWQDAGAATSLLHLANFDTSGGKVLLQTDLSYHADAVAQFVDNNATFHFQPDWTITNQSSSSGVLQALDPNNFPNLDPQGAILRASASLSLSTALNTSTSIATSGTAKVTISPNPLTIPPGPTTLSQNNLLIGTAQTATIANASDLNTISTTGLDFNLTGSSPSSFNLNVPGFTNNGGAVGGRRATVTATFTFVTPASISGEKFLDSNANGAQDAGEPGLQGWEIDLTGTTAPIVDENNVVLLASQSVSFQVFTDANGNYTFNPNQTLTLTNGGVIPITGLLPGTYTISENNAFNLANHPGISAPSYVETLPGPNQNYSVTIGATGTATSGSLTGNNFGNFPVQPAARISITQLGNTTNEVNASHTFQATVEYDDGLPANMFGGDGVNGFAPISGQNVTFSLVDSNGASHSILAGGIDPTNSSGIATINFTSSTAGQVTGEASVTVNGLTVDTDPLTVTPNSTDPTRPGVDGPVVKTFVDADISISPPNATNPIGVNHTLTVNVEENTGNGSWIPAPNGTVVTLNLTNSNGASAVFVDTGTATETVTITNGLGNFQVQINSATAGDVTINASTTLTVGGVSLTRSTGDGKGETGHFDSGPAIKHYVDGTLEWIKHDNNGALLAGATFLVTGPGGPFTVTDNVNPFDANPTGGLFEMDHVQLGTYTIQEITAPASFTLDPTIQTVTLTVQNPSNAANPPVFVDTPIQEAEIRMTGGGSVFLDNAPGTVGGPVGTRVTHGFELHCGTGPNGIENVNNHLEINWNPDPNPLNAKEQHFHLLYLTAITCENDPNIDPAPAPFTAGGMDTIIGAGVGRYSGIFNGVRYKNVAATVTFILTDAGEPGTSDTASYIVKLADGTIVLNTGDSNGDNVRDLKDYNALKTPFTLVPPTSSSDPGQPDIPDQLFLFKGNQQVHPELKKLTGPVLALEAKINRVYNQLNSNNLSQSKLDNLIGQLNALYTQLNATQV